MNMVKKIKEAVWWNKEREIVNGYILLAFMAVGLLAVLLIGSFLIGE